MTWKLTPFALLIVALGCGGGSSHHGGGIPNQPLTITINPATGIPADGTSAATINIHAQNASTGAPIVSEVVTLTATGSGNIIVQPAPTDALGNSQGKIATTVPELKTVTAQGPTAADIATGTVTFVKTNQTQAATLAIIGGNNQTGSAGGVLANPLDVKVTDPSGAGIAGVPINFTVTSGGGVLSITSTTTDNNGIARTTMRLGSAGDNTVTVVAKDESGNQLAGSPQVFHELAQ